MRPVVLLHLQNCSVFSLTVCSLPLQFQNNKVRKQKIRFQESLEEGDVIRYFFHAKECNMILLFFFYKHL